MFNKQKLVSTTEEIFEDCVLPNGAIVGAPSHMDYYPKDAKSYMYVWPGRDVGFAIAGMSLIGHDVAKPHLNWILDRAESFLTGNSKNKTKGLLYRSYYPNGLIRENQFQVDQGATLIWGIDYKNRKLHKKFSNVEIKIIKLIANSIDELYTDFGFNIEVEDLWEERGIRPKHGFFTYSLAANARALDIAERVLNISFENSSQDLKENLEKLHKNHEQYYWKISNKYSEHRQDGSLAGLIWPFNMGWDKNKLKNTLLDIEDHIMNDYMVYRYEDDKYEGKHSFYMENENAGSWPLLSFWMSIAWAELGEIEKAKTYFNKIIEKIDGDYFIPEQIFPNNKDFKGVKPLLWSNIMALFAAEKLKLL